MHPKPQILISRCLGFEACRWDGQIIETPFIEALKPHVSFVDVCPECAIGLGVPRLPLRLVRKPDSDPLRMIQPATGRDLTKEMNGFANSFIASMPSVDGAILKTKSPSCGLSGVKAYHRENRETFKRDGQGIFATALKSAHPHLPAEDEGRLMNLRIREHFLTRIFLNARLREVEASGELKPLIDFHSSCKYLLMAYSQSGLSALGRIVAAGSKRTAKATFLEYAKLFRRTLAKPPRGQSAVNALQHMMGHFSDSTSSAERVHLSGLFEEFRQGRVPLGVPSAILKSWAIRFDERYILSQTLLTPYPEALVSPEDSEKGREA